MKRIVVAGLGVLWVANASFAQTKPAAPDGDQEEVRLSVGNDSEYQSMLTELGLDDATKAVVQERIDERRKKLSEFVDGDKGRRLEAKREELRQARIKKDNAQVSALRHEIQPLADEYWQLRQETRRDILKALPEPQFKKYVGLVLCQRLLRPLAGIDLTPMQHDKIRALADGRAATFVTPDTIAGDPFFRWLEPLTPDLRRTIQDDILTPAQRIQLRERRATTQSAASRPTTQP